MIATILHYSLHFIAPLGIAYAYNRKKWQKGYLILIATMLVDLDHLLADPVFDPNRCSIGFHPLHSEWAIMMYIILLWPKKTRLVSIGLLFHMLTDKIDCYL